MAPLFCASKGLKIKGSPTDFVMRKKRRLAGAVTFYQLLFSASNNESHFLSRDQTSESCPALAQLLQCPPLYSLCPRQ